MLNIQELTDRENKLLSQVHGIVGSMNEKTQQLIESGVFDSYRDLHNDYVSLAKDGNREALKRAFFIQWYGIAEPSCFTGIPSSDPWGDGRGINKETETAVFDLVAQFINSDNELKWMTAWYYQIADYYLESFWKDSAIINDLRKYNQEIDSLVSDAKLNDEPLKERGQMGVYFMSILNSNASRTK
jgi:hypothetical protein